MDALLPWKRVRSALFQYAREHDIESCRVPEVLGTLSRILDLCGDYSKNRRNLYRLGIVLLQECPHILAPACPDYTNARGRFTYKGLGDGLPMLVKRHAMFLHKVCAVVPKLRVTFLIADHEACVKPLCEIMGVTTQEFKARVGRSIAKAKMYVAPYQWLVCGFTEMIPGFSQQESRLVSQLMQDPRLQRRFASETLARISFYQKVGYTDPQQWRLRTYHNAAQYLVLGRFAASHNLMVCNHHTASLGWFTKAGNAYLDNPIKIY